MNELVQDAIEFGLMTHFDRRTKLIMHIKDQKKHGEQRAISTDSVTMKELHFLYIIFAIGVTFSIVVFVGEILVRKFRQ